jgi:hypothetical protein
MKLFMQIGPPFGTIGYIIDNSLVGDPLWGTAFPRAAAKFHMSDDAVRDAHTGNYTGIEIRKIS